MNSSEAISLDQVVTEAGRVAVLMGGPSAEREISLQSGTAVSTALQHSGIEVLPLDWSGNLLEQLSEASIDRVFIALHGRGGEDGQVQGLLDICGYPYTGSGVLGCALSMDKIRAKQVWQSVGVPTPSFVTVAADFDIDEILSVLGLPMMVKPAREGSSIGISLVNNAEEITAAVTLARYYDDLVIAEKFIVGREYTLAILDGETLPTIRLETPRPFYDYEAKYVATTTRYICPSGLDEALEVACAAAGLAAFNHLDASGWGRIDFMFDEVSRPWFIELNTVPGMTDHSLVPMAAKARGIDFEELVLRILRTSFKGTKE